MDDSMTRELGEALRNLREAAGLTVYQLHQRTGIARAHLYRLEAGEIGEPRPEMLNLLASEFGIEPEELYEIAWQTTGTGPGLPSLPTYFRAKYQLDDTQIAALERTLKRVAPDGTRSSSKKNKKK